MAPVQDGGLTISPDGSTATLQMQKLPIIDQPRWPALDSEVKPAFMSFRMVWKRGDAVPPTDDTAKMFRFNGHNATVQMEVQVEVPGDGFTWKSDPLETSQCKFAQWGDEVNGKYYASK